MTLHVIQNTCKNSWLEWIIEYWLHPKKKEIDFLYKRIKPFVVGYHNYLIISSTATMGLPNFLLLVIFFNLSLLCVQCHPDYRDALAKSIIFFQGQRSGPLPPQDISWRGSSGLSDGSLAGVSALHLFLCIVSMLYMLCCFNWKWWNLYLIIHPRKIVLFMEDTNFNMQLIKYDKV